MVKAVLFDADGVLINSEMFSVALQRVHGISIDKTRKFFSEKWPEIIIGSKDLKTELRPYLPQLGWDGTVDELLDFWFKTEHNIDEDLVSFIQGLRRNGIKCYVATNQERYRANYMLKEMGFSESFDGVLASAHLGSKKPDLEFFKLVLDKLELNIDEVMFWDDSQENVSAGNEFGLKSHLYQDYDKFKEVMKAEL